MLKLKILPKKDKIDNSWSVEKIVKEYTPQSWENVFENSINELKDISDILEEDRKENGERLPNNHDLFRAFQVTPLHKVRVVIIGQDPYHSVMSDGTPLATGMAFSVPRNSQIPSSLRNIFKELKNTVPEFNNPTHGDLTNWAIQGVLLLNSCLTVRPGRPDCFKQIWSGFLKKVINEILEVNPNCIFVAWGNNAQKFASKFVGERAVILTAVHPSGLSANRGFFGCDHFNKINQLLTELKSPAIDWNLY